MTEILVLGGSGFIGKNIIIESLKKKWKVTSLSYKKKININNKFLKQYNIKLSDKKKLSKILKNKSFDYVINASGYVDHSDGVMNLRHIMDQHFLNIINIIPLINTKKLKRFIQIGSGDEYGKFNKKLNENFREQPLSNYAFAKMTLTKYLQMLQLTESFPCVILRVFLLYGPYQQSNRMIPFVIKNCLSDNSFPASKGNQLRDFCYIDDFIELIFKILLSKRKINGSVYNVGSGKHYKVKDVINLIKNIIKSGKPNYGTIITKFKLNLIPDLKKVHSTFNWKSTTNLKHGIIKTIDHIKNNGN